MAEKVRVFIAVSMPDDVKRQLAEIEKKLSLSGADVKWVAESNFHITLKFLGDVDSSRLEEISSAVESAVLDIEPFEVALSGVGAFPNIRRPSVIWVGISAGGDELKKLAEKIEAALEPMGFAREARPFSAHITVGRTRTPRNIGQLRESIDCLKDIQAGAFRVDEAAVMKSELRPSGSMYTKLASCGLQTAQNAG